MHERLEYDTSTKDKNYRRITLQRWISQTSTLTVFLHSIEYMHIYIYICARMCVCVCVCVLGISCQCADTHIAVHEQNKKTERFRIEKNCERIKNVTSYESFSDYMIPTNRRHVFSLPIKRTSDSPFNPALMAPTSIPRVTNSVNSKAKIVSIPLCMSCSIQN